MSISLKGGLGNQLFQIFSLIGIAEKNNYKYIIDKEYNDNRKTYWDNILSSIPNCSNKNEFKNSELFIVNENRYTQYMDIELNKNEMPNVMLKGYFQSFYYFENIRDKIFNFFKNKVPIILETPQPNIHDDLNYLKSWQ